jgi:tRNA(adenine34) deaminase
MMASDGAGHEAFMRRALELAERARSLGEVPIGALVVSAGAVVGEGFNQPISTHDPTRHAEIVALRAAARAAANYRLPGTTLYVTVEPCLMCVGAMVNARVSVLVYGAREPKFGAVSSLLDARALALNHRFEVVEGVLADDGRRLLQDFFRGRRAEP